MNEWFFDLEGTLIDSWHKDHPVIINKDVISNFIERKDIREISIFSGVIWNCDDSDRFFWELQERIENVFGIKIKNVVSMDDAKKQTSRWRTCFFDTIGELVSMVGKDIIFKEFCFDKQQDDVAFWLIDDEFPEELTIRNIDGKNLSVGIIPIQSL